MLGHPLPPERRAEIGREVLAERLSGTRWKVLSKRYAYGISRLRMFLRAAEKEAYKEETTSI